MSAAPTTGADPSLSMLQRIVEDAMDPGYREASFHTSGGASEPRTGWRGAASVALVLFAIGFLLVAAVLQVRAGAPASSETRAELAQRVESATAEAATESRQVDELAREVQALRGSALAGTVADQQLAAQVSALEARVGGRPVSGPGLRVTMTDGPPSPAGEGGPDLARVLDTDVQLVVNGMFAAGAEAVSVNDQRVTALSPIRSAGEAILVGFRPLTPPYQITAVGPESLPASFAASRARQELAGLAAAYGMGVDVVGLDRATVPARSDLEVRYAHEVRPSDPTSKDQEGSP